jgi:hypothetical protein
MIAKGAAMKKLLLLSLCAFLGAAAPLRAKPRLSSTARNAPSGARVAPDRFLRAYDPVTVFFSADTGPKAGGAEDAPQKYVTMTPQPAGECAGSVRAHCSFVRRRLEAAVARE